MMGLGADRLAAQESSHTDIQGWVEYQWRRQANEKLRVNWRLGYREAFSTETIDWSRLHLATVLGYQISPLVNLEGGLGGYYSFQDPARDVFELRTWQGVVLRWPEVRLPRRHFPLNHRLRLEQRWIDTAGDSGTNFGMRLRYRLAIGIPLNGPEIEEKTYYLPLATEFFYDLRDDTEEPFAARARVTAGLGYVIGKNWAVELRYTGQRTRDTLTDTFETTDHILDLRIRTTLRIRDLSMPW